MVARRTIAAARRPACRVSALPPSWNWINRRDAHLQASGEMISGHFVTQLPTGTEKVL